MVLNTLHAVEHATNGGVPGAYVMYTLCRYGRHSNLIVAEDNTPLPGTLPSRHAELASLFTHHHQRSLLGDTRAMHRGFTAARALMMFPVSSFHIRCRSYYVHTQPKKKFVAGKKADYGANFSWAKCVTSCQYPTSALPPPPPPRLDI